VREIGEMNMISSQLENTFAGLTNGTVRFAGALSFLAQTYPLESYVGARYFAGFYEKKLIGVSAFNPMYRRGEIVGYSEVVPKRSPLAPKGTRVGILIGALRQFEAEGIKLVSLGLSPFHKVKENNQTCPLSNCRLTARLFEQVYRFGELSFNYHGLSFHKSRFKGDEKTVYYASRSRLPLVELLKIYKLTTSRWVPPLFKHRITLPSRED
jgi:lysylphosphatidylglycerol synthetase-like protein (DUF2156 family)